MKIAFTGGHLTPALAVIDSLSKDIEIIFIGRKYSLEGDKALSLEYRIITERNIKFIPITTGRLQRKISRNTLVSLFKIPSGMVEALIVLIKNKPDIVVGFGGYISLPVGFAAKLLNIPLVIHEQTLDSGLANKILAKYAQKICISWKQSEKYFPKHKTILTGNPIIKSFNNKIDLPVSDENLPLIFITGGSTGSHVINDLILNILEKVLRKYKIIHQTGDSKEFHDYEQLEKFKKNLPYKLQNRYFLQKFIEPNKMISIMQRSDLIIARSGMNTVTELLSIGKPCLLIPLQHGQKNEQLKNAELIKKIGIGDFLTQSELDSEKLYENIERMMFNLSKYKIHTASAKQVVSQDASKNIIKVIYDAVKKKK